MDGWRKDSGGQLPGTQANSSILSLASLRRGWRGGGGGTTPWCVLVCSWLHQLADRHLLPFPWTLSLHRRWCPSTPHRPVSNLSLRGLIFPLYVSFLSLGRLCQRSPQTFPVSLLWVGSTQRGGGGGHPPTPPHPGASLAVVQARAAHSAWDTSGTPIMAEAYTLQTGPPHAHAYQQWRQCGRHPAPALSPSPPSATAEAGSSASCAPAPAAQSCCCPTSRWRRLYSSVWPGGSRAGGPGGRDVGVLPLPPRQAHTTLQP